MRIIVDVEKCCGHGVCEGQAPEVFRLNDEGYQSLPVVEVRPGDEKAALDAVHSCPEQCLSVAPEENA